LKESMPTKWIYKMSIMLLIYSKFFFVWCRWWFEVEFFWGEKAWCDHGYNIKGSIRSVYWVYSKALIKVDLRGV
jgi:hypothetical protein